MVRAPRLDFRRPGGLGAGSDARKRAGVSILWPGRAGARALYIVSRRGALRCSRRAEVFFFRMGALLGLRRAASMSPLAVPSGLRSPRNEGPRPIWIAPFGAGFRVGVAASRGRNSFLGCGLSYCATEKWRGGGEVRATPRARVYVRSCTMYYLPAGEREPFCEACGGRCRAADKQRSGDEDLVSRRRALRYGFDPFCPLPWMERARRACGLSGSRTPKVAFISTTYKFRAGRSESVCIVYRA